MKPLVLNGVFNEHPGAPKVVGASECTLSLCRVRYVAARGSYKALQPVCHGHSFDTIQSGELPILKADTPQSRSTGGSVVWLRAGLGNQGHLRTYDDWQTQSNRDTGLPEWYPEGCFTCSMFAESSQESAAH